METQPCKHHMLHVPKYEKLSAEGGVYAIHHPEEQRTDAGTHLRRGSLVCVHMAGGLTPPTASERAIGGCEVTGWPMWGCTGLSAGSLGKSMAKVPTGSGENDSEGASPTDEPPPGEGMEGICRDLKAVTTCCKRATSLTFRSQCKLPDLSALESVAGALGLPLHAAYPQKTPCYFHPQLRADLCFT